MRCSILFHLLVPGGKWQTETVIPVSSASLCRANFHSLVLLPLGTVRKLTVQLGRSRQDAIVPFAVEFVSPEIDLGHLAVSDLDSGRIDITVQSAGHLQLLLGFGGGESDDCSSRLTPEVATERV